MRKLLLSLSVLVTIGTTAGYAADVAEITAKSYADQGIAAYRRGDYPTAIKFLAGRARMAPENADVYYYLGNSYLKTNQNEQAAKMYSACVRADAKSQAAEYSLSALEKLSSMPKAPPPENKPPAGTPDPEATKAQKEALLTEAPIDKVFNDAVVRIKSQRQTLKSRLDRMYEQMQDDLHSLPRRGNPTYAQDLERIRRDAEIAVEQLQSKQLRWENRLLAPDKIDVRAIPKLPEEKPDDTKTALGSLIDLFTPEKPFDPFGTDIKPEMVSKFMNMKDVFGELSTYEKGSRRICKQAFLQLKSNIENKQDLLDMQIHQAKSNLIKDIVSIKNNYGNQSYMNRSSDPTFHISSSKMPRNDPNYMTPMEQDIQKATDRAKARILDLQNQYNRDVDSMIAGAKERVGGMVAQAGQMNSQLKHPSGNIQLVPLGTDTYTRNYVNFADHSDPSYRKHSAAKIEPLRAQQQKLQTPAAVAKPKSESKPAGK